MEDTYLQFKKEQEYIRFLKYVRTVPALQLPPYPESKFFFYFRKLFLIFYIDTLDDVLKYTFFAEEINFNSKYAKFQPFIDLMKFCIFGYLFSNWNEFPIVFCICFTAICLAQIIFIIFVRPYRTNFLAVQIIYCEFSALLVGILALLLAISDRQIKNYGRAESFLDDKQRFLIGNFFLF